MSVQRAGDIAKETTNDIKASDLKMSTTVSNHMNDIITRGSNKGDLARGYIDSNGTNMLIDEIIGAGNPVNDASLASGLKWVVDGTYKGSSGTWELVVDTATNMIVHFNFISN